MTNSLLSGDSALPAASATPAAALLAEEVGDLSGEGPLDVLQKPETSPLEKPQPAQLNHHRCLPHPIKGQKPELSRADISPKIAPKSPASIPHHRSRRQAACDSKKDSGVRQNDNLSQLKTADAGQTHVKRSRRYRVYVKNNMGTVHVVKVRATDSVMRVKEKVSMTMDVFPQAMHIVFNGVELLDEHATMGKLGVVEGNTLYLTPRLQSGQLEMFEGSQVSDENLYEKIMAHLSEQQMEELSSGRFHKPVSFVATLGGKRVLVRLKPAGDAAMASASLCTAPGELLDTDPWMREPTSKTGSMRKDPQWRCERQIEHKNMRSCMEGVRERLRQAKAARTKRMAAPAAPDEHVKSNASSNQAPMKQTTPSVSVEGGAVVSKTRCQACCARLGSFVFPCKCCHYFCPAHRHDHRCMFDYRAQQ